MNDLTTQPNSIPLPGSSLLGGDVAISLERREPSADLSRPPAADVQAKVEVGTYLSTLPASVPASDRTLFEAAAHVLHEAGASKEVFQALTSRYTDVMRMRAEIDEEDRQETEALLRREYGGDYSAKIAAALSLIPAGAEAIFNARDDDDFLLLNDPGVVRWLVNLAHRLNRVSTQPQPSGVPRMTIDDEIVQIEDMMRDRSSAYWQGPRAASLQTRYRDLLEARNLGSDSVAAPRTSSIDDEIAKIEEVMRRDRRKYNADSRMQQRYRELLSRRG